MSTGQIKMKRRVEWGSEAVCYELTQKQVKNINLRVNHRGEVFVSAAFSVSVSYVDRFVWDRRQFIRNAREKIKEREKQSIMADPDPLWTREQQLQFLTTVCKEVYPLFLAMGVPFPEIRVRKMKARWGSCRYREGVITLNTQLIRVPRKYAIYVAIHEFAHFIQPDHSPEFYKLMAKLCPDWRELRKELNAYRF